VATGRATDLLTPPARLLSISPPTVPSVWFFMAMAGAAFSINRVIARSAGSVGLFFQSSSVANAQRLKLRIKQPIATAQRLFFCNKTHNSEV